MSDIKERKDPKTWCGFPHNLLVPRSKALQPWDNLTDAQEFSLLAFVTDVDQDVVEGSDGVEHMICGHKHLDTKIDKRPFGFPFDREINFKYDSNERFLGETMLKIIYRPSDMSQYALAKIIDTIPEEEASTASTSTTTSSTPTTTNMENFNRMMNQEAEIISDNYYSSEVDEINDLERYFYDLENDDKEASTTEKADNSNIKKVSLKDNNPKKETNRKEDNVNNKEKQKDKNKKQDEDRKEVGSYNGKSPKGYTTSAPYDYGNHQWQDSWFGFWQRANSQFRH